MKVYGLVVGGPVHFQRRRDHTRFVGFGFCVCGSQFRLEECLHGGVCVRDKRVVVCTIDALVGHAGDADETARGRGSVREERVTERALTGTAVVFFNGAWKHSAAGDEAIQRRMEERELLVGVIMRSASHRLVGDGAVEVEVCAVDRVDLIRVR